MTRLIFIPLVLGTLVLASCALFQQPTDPWIGQTKDQLQAQKGSPGNKVSDNQGGEDWIYVEHVGPKSDVLTQDKPNAYLIDYIMIHHFYIDATGVIYKHRASKQ